MKTTIILLAWSIFLASCSKSASKPSTGTDSLANPVDNISINWTATKPSIFKSVDDIFFVSPATGFLISGDSTSIYITGDSGKTWAARPLGISGGWFNLRFLNQTNGFLQSDRSIAVTTDGGNTWSKKVLPTSNAYSFAFTSPLNGFYCDYYLGVFRTVDGGNTWNNQYKNTGSGKNGYFLSFLNSEKGFLVSDNVGIFTTIDNGINWKLLGNTLPATTDAFSETGPVVFNQLQFVDDSVGFYARVDGLFKTTDGGQTWKGIRTRTPGTVSCVYFFDRMNGYYSNGQDLLSTVDGGSTWDNVWPFNADYIIAMNFTDIDHGWIGTGHGRVVRKYR